MKKISVAQVILSLRALDFLDVRSSSCSNLVRLFLTTSPPTHAPTREWSPASCLDSPHTHLSLVVEDRVHTMGPTRVVGAAPP